MPIADGRIKYSTASCPRGNGHWNHFGPDVGGGVTVRAGVGHKLPFVIAVAQSFERLLRIGQWTFLNAIVAGH